MPPKSSLGSSSGRHVSGGISGAQPAGSPPAGPPLGGSPLVPGTPRRQAGSSPFTNPLIRRPRRNNARLSSSPYGAQLLRHRLHRRSSSRLRSSTPAGAAQPSSPNSGPPQGNTPPSGGPPKPPPPPQNQPQHQQGGQPGSNDDRRWEGIRDWLCEFFDMYRQGQADPSAFAKVHPSIPSDMADIGTWLKGALLHFGPLSVFRPAQDQEGEKTREQWLHAQGLVAAIVRVLKGSPSKLQFNRVLAWGGCGLVALFDVGAPSAVGQVVVKCELSASRVPFEKEKQCHDFLRRSKHIVQRVKLQLDPINQSPAHTTSQARPADDNLLILEFLRRGDLNKYLTKLAAKFLKAFEELEQKMAKHGGNLPQDYVLQNLAPTEFPDEVLWLIFEFLFKGVIGILAPPKVRPEYDETGGDDGPLVDETPPDRNMPLERQDIVHFDLDPRNVLIGSFDHVPIHKISDLGHMKPMRDLKADSQQYEEMWSSRLRGKPRIYWLTPEQFSQEWDRISHHPRDAPPPGVRVAGNYSWKTNLYAIGQIMWCLITRFEPPPPRYATQIDTGDGDFEDINTKKWSYGAYLLQGNFDHVDSDLRNLVVECMMDDPADRPRMHKMWKVIQKKTAGDLDKYVKEWCADFYSEALVALPHTSEKLQEWLNNNFDFGVLFPNKSFGRSQSATPPSPFAKGGAPAAP